MTNRLKPWSNSGLPQQASAKMKPPCSTKSRRFCLARAENSGALWPLKKAIGAWSMSWIVAALGVDDLPGEQVFPFVGDDADQVANVVGVLVPVAAGKMAELVDQDRRATLGQEQQGQAGRPRSRSRPRPLQNPESLFCVRTSSSAPRRYQSFWPKKRTPASRPARSSP